MTRDRDLVAERAGAHEDADVERGRDARRRGDVALECLARLGAGGLDAALEEVGERRHRVRAREEAPGAEAGAGGGRRREVGRPSREAERGRDRGDGLDAPEAEGGEIRPVRSVEDGFFVPGGPVCFVRVVVVPGERDLVGVARGRRLRRDAREGSETARAEQVDEVALELEEARDGPRAEVGVDVRVDDALRAPDLLQHRHLRDRVRDAELRERRRAARRAHARGDRLVADAVALARERRGRQNARPLERGEGAGGAGGGAGGGGCAPSGGPGCATAIIGTPSAPMYTAPGWTTRTRPGGRARGTSDGAASGRPLASRPMALRGRGRFCETTAHESSSGRFRRGRARRPPARGCPKIMFANFVRLGAAAARTRARAHLAAPRHPPPRARHGHGPARGSRVREAAEAAKAAEASAPASAADVAAAPPPAKRPKGDPAPPPRSARAWTPRTSTARRARAREARVRGSRGRAFMARAPSASEDASRSFNEQKRLRVAAATAWLLAHAELWELPDAARAEASAARAGASDAARDDDTPRRASTPLAAPTTPRRL